MIQKFGGIFSPAYQFSDSFKDLPEKLLKNIAPLSVDWKKEPFVAACWIHNFLSSGKIFVLITCQRVVYKDPARVNQNLFVDMTGVERSKLMQNITLLSPGNPNKLFPSNARPGDKLMTLLFDKINATWIKTRQEGRGAAGTSTMGAAPGSSSSSEIMDQIEKLSELRSKGILTENEFLEKKKDLLAKI